MGGQKEEPDNLQLWEELLGLFGTDEARERFKDLSGKYYEYLMKIGKAKDVKSIEVYELGRRNIHQKIMETVFKLMTQASVEPEQKNKLRVLSNRDRVEKMIQDVFGPHSPAEKEKMEHMTELGRFRKKFDD